MIKRSVAAVTVLFAVGLMALPTLTPTASAAPCASGACQGGGPGGSSETCNPASATCTVGEYALITLSGSYSQNANDYVNLPPPPCLWSPIGGAEIGSEVILDFGRQLDHMQPSPWQMAALKALAQVLGEAGDLLEQAQAKPPGPPGNWYQIQPNPAVSAAASASCGQGLDFVWVPAGAAPPAAQRLPAIDLADYALDHMVLPDPTVTTSPAAEGYVNFATYVWTRWPTLRTTGRAREVTATLAVTGQSVTVWAQPKVTISVNGPGTTYYSCSVDGSKYPLGKAPALAAGVPPDCGVLWTATDIRASVSASITWTVTYYDGGPDGPIGKSLTPPGTIPTQGTSRALRIDAIEAIN
jgi:hypothetical protein